MKKNARYIILGIFIALVLVLTYLISTFIISDKSYENIAIKSDLPIIEEKPLKDEDLEANKEKSLEDPIPPLGDNLQDTDSPPEDVQVEVIPDKENRKTQVIKEEKTPEFDAADMKKNPEKKSSLRDNDYTTVTLNKGQTLWDVARTTGDKNPWRWTDILRANYMKSRYLIFDSDVTFWFVIIGSGQTLNVPKNDIKIKYNRKEPKKLAVQIAAYPEDSKKLAYDFTEQLNRDGYFAYVYLTDTKIKSKKYPVPQKYYRVRIGFFETSGEGVELAEEIISRYKDKEYSSQDYFIVEPSYKELDGRLFNFGIQLSLPYAIEIMETEDKTAAINAIKNFKIGEKYPYLIKKKTGNTRYAIRLGFFSSEKEAEKHMQELMGKNSEVYFSAKVIKLDSVMETAAGQNVNLYLPY